MPLNLRCDCGHELYLPDEEAKELTWCPRCHKILVRPPEYRSAKRPFVKRGAGSGTTSARIGAGIAIAAVIAIARLTCLNSFEQEPRTYEAPDFSVPQLQFQELDRPDWPPQDGGQLPPGFLPPGVGGNPFPLDKEPPARDDGPIFPPRDPDDP